MEKIKLVDAIAHLRRELYEANEVSKHEGLKLEIEAIDVEFEVEVERRGEAGAEFSFNVLVAGGRVKAVGDIGNTHSHRLKLHLKPSLNGQRLPIGHQGRPEDD